MPPNRLHPFDELILSKGHDVRVAHAALLFALDEYSDLAVQAYLDRLSSLAERIGRARTSAPGERIEAVRRVLVNEEGYAGDQDNYYDPRNSYLSAVMDRKRGLPITLAAIWIDVAEQLGWGFEGVNFPGHYLLRCPGEDGATLVAPFDGGRTVGDDELPTMLQNILGREAPLKAEHLQIATALGTLTRMLNNLRSVYATSREWGKAMRIVTRMLAIEPESESLKAEYENLTRRQADMN